MRSAARLRASLLLNVVLAATVAGLGLHRWQRPSTAAVKTPSPAQPRPAAPAPAPRMRYTEIASALERRRSMIDALRALGVSNDVLGLVAHLDREVEWEARFEQCHGNMNRLEALQLEKDRNKDAEMVAALGEKDFKQWDTRNMLWEAMSTAVETTPVEAETIYAAKKQLERRLLDAQQARLNGLLDVEGEGAVTEKAYAEFNQQLKAALGPERYAKSQQLDDGFAADNLRAVLAKAAVTPSESQFQELFRLEKQFDAAQLKLGRQRQENPSSLDFPAQFRALNEARDLEYERILGHELSSTLQKAKDPGYTQMKKYETYWGLDDGKIDYVYAAMKQYDNAVLDYVTLSRAKSQSTEAVKNHLVQLTAETQQTLQNYLGRDSFSRLQRNRIVQFYQPGARR